MDGIYVFSETSASRTTRSRIAASATIWAISIGSGGRCGIAASGDLPTKSAGRSHSDGNALSASRLRKRFNLIILIVHYRLYELFHSGSGSSTL